MLRGVVDRIEGDVVVLGLSDGNQLVVKRHHLPEQVVEGSVLDVTFTLNEAAAAEQRRKVEDLQQQLSEKGKKEPGEG
jgi:DUF3006 family protein